MVEEGLICSYTLLSQDVIEKEYNSAIEGELLQRSSSIIFGVEAQYLI